MVDTPFDTSRCYVRIIERKTNGWIEFEFSIGDPELYVELVMPEIAFQEFCMTKQVEQLPPRQETCHLDDFEWNLRAATQQRFR